MDTASRIASAIRRRELPALLTDLFALGETDDASSGGPAIEFHAITPHNLVLSQGAGIICSAIAFHNSGGGLFVLGATDARFLQASWNEPLNLSVFDWVLRNWTGEGLRVKTATYPHPAHPDASIEIILVPPRRDAGLLRLRQGFDRFNAGDILVREGTGVIVAAARHFERLSRSGAEYGTGDAPVHAALPARPPAPWSFVGRDQHMAALLQWFTQDGTRRLYLRGPDGAGRTMLAAEFGRRLAAAGQGILLPGGARLNHVIFVGGDAPDDGAGPAARILGLSGWAQGLIDDPAVIDHEMTGFLAASNGLIILDGRYDADQRLLIQILAAKRHNKVLYAHAPGQMSALDQSIEVAGFGEEAEYEAFLEGCAARFGTAAPTKAEYEAIARWSHGLPGRIEGLFGLRRGTGNFAEAIATAGELRP